jgi:hypothetical protein
MRNLSRRYRMFPKFFLSVVVVVTASFTSGADAAVSAADYRASLLQILGRYEGVLALRDACTSAFPQSKASVEKAFSAWQTRHRKFISELEQRFSLMIRAYSKDDKDYARNFGKYQGQLLQQREEVKQAHLLESRGELETRCKALPEFLQSRESDIESEFANEILILRQWSTAPK